jgi:hypothetical protein
MLPLLGVGMAEIAGRHDFVPDELLELLGLGEAPGLGARPDELAIDTHLEHAARIVGDERDGADLLGEVESSSCAIQAALSSQPHSRQ